MAHVYGYRDWGPWLGVYLWGMSSPNSWPSWLSGTLGCVLVSCIPWIPGMWNSFLSSYQSPLLVSTGICFTRLCALKLARSKAPPLAIGVHVSRGWGLAPGDRCLQGACGMPLDSSQLWDHFLGSARWGYLRPEATYLCVLATPTSLPPAAFCYCQGWQDKCFAEHL